MTDDRAPLGTALMICFCVIAPLIDTFAKLASTGIPVGQIAAARYIVQALILLPVMVWLRLSLPLGRARIGPVFLSAVLSLASTFTFVAAIRIMPLADALAIVFVEPFLLLLIGHFFLNEHVGIRRIGAAVVGFVGTLIIIRPSFAEFGPVALLPLGTALFFALYMLVTRRQSKGTHPVTLQATTAIAAVVLSVPILWLTDGSGWRDLDPVWPKGIFWLWLFGVGLGASVSHLFLTYALRYASSTVLAPLHYLELVSATVLGYLVFSDFPDRAALFGIAIIVVAGLYIIHRERMTARAPLPVPFDPT